MKTGWPGLTQADFEWKLEQLNAYCNNLQLHKTVGPALELGTCVSGRLLLEFIGIGAHWQKPPYELFSRQKKGRDVSCEDFGIAPYPIATLDDSDKDLLINFIIRAHRIAHFTRDNEPDRFKWTCLAAPLVNKLFREHFYNKLKEQLPIK